MSGLFGNNIFTIAQKSLDFRTSRHDLLASNVANKDTPGYQAEDLVFRASLEKALHAAIATVSADLEQLGLNTAVAALLERE